jgi:hypothetical protein
VVTAPGEYPDFDRETYEELVKRSYGLHKRDDEYFEKRIGEKTEAYWDYWLKRLRQRRYTTIKEEPMISLRDIGKQVDINPDTNEVQFYKRIVRGD